MALRRLRPLVASRMKSAATPATHRPVRDGRSVSGGRRLGAGSSAEAALGGSARGRGRRVAGVLRLEPLAELHLPLHAGRPTVPDPAPLGRHTLLRRPLAGPATEA